MSTSSKLKCVFGCGQDGLFPVKSGGMKCANHHNKCPAKKKSLSTTVSNQWAALTDEQKRENARGLLNYRDGGIRHQEVVQKARISRITNGTYLNPDHQTEYQRYRTEVRRLTGQNYRKFIKFINPDNLPRGKEWHLDHRLSIIDGFRMDIPAEMMAHPANLEIVEGHQNQSKGRASSITRDELYDLASVMALCNFRLMT